MEQDGALKKKATEEAQALKMDGATGTWAQAKWASIKSKARDAREYAVAMTRQKFAMFGEANKVEPDHKEGGASKVEPDDKEASKDESPIEPSAWTAAS
ncbi:hypothetical protein HU200_023874 [Digitaria exilis]|uniref:Uncharacterized protein n=1 Tax=Digitaria exilis TaxID=1010633 RepID=A0A835EXB9_9POAL|nr:hypothetical protein HU200_023874 [Digitaria exilis]